MFSCAIERRTYRLSKTKAYSLNNNRLIIKKKKHHAVCRTIDFSKYTNVNKTITVRNIFFSNNFSENLDNSRACVIINTCN